MCLGSAVGHVAHGASMVVITLRADAVFTERPARRTVGLSLTCLHASHRLARPARRAVAHHAALNANVNADVASRSAARLTAVSVAHAREAFTGWGIAMKRRQRTVLVSRAAQRRRRARIAPREPQSDPAPQADHENHAESQPMLGRIRPGGTHRHASIQRECAQKACALSCAYAYGTCAAETTAW
jgi:hypothetical protein